MKTRVEKIIYIGITLSWLLAMAMLVERYYFRQVPETDLSSIRLPPAFFEEHWMGMYMHGEKVGYSFSKITPGNGGYRFEGVLKMRFNVLNEEKAIETTVSARLGNNLKLVSFDAKLTSDFSMKASGRIEDKKLILDIQTGGETRSHVFKLDREPSLNMALIPEMLHKGLKEGRKIRMPLFDPASLSIRDWEMEISGREVIMSMGRRQDAYKLRGDFRGMEFVAWVTGDGEVLREESPAGFTLIKESREDAQKGGISVPDLIALTSVPFNLVLPEGISYLKVRVSGIDFRGLELDGGRQRMKGNIIEIKKEGLPQGIALPGSRGMDDYLKETMFIQSTDPAIISASRAIVRDEKDSLAMARMINTWVHENVKKMPVIGIPSAVEVLKKKQGDCNEHTALFTALSRAAGIPARIAVGVVYRDRAFYYHAWPEVYLKDWVAVDPTFGQFPADATHIRLLTGDLIEQMRLISVIGRIKLEGLEYR